MDRNDIIRMAREAGILETMGYGNPHMKAWQADVVRELSHFAALVAAAERDRMCEQFNIPKELAHEKAKGNETN